MTDQNDNALKSEALAWVDRAQAITIEDQTGYELAGEKLVAIASLEKQIRDHHAPIIESAWKNHQVAIAAQKRLLDPLIRAKDIITTAMGSWSLAERRRRAALQEKLDEIARKKEIKARERIAETARTFGASKKTVKEILAKPLPIRAPIVKPSAPTPAGVAVNSRANLSFRIADATLVPKDFMSVDEAKIRAHIKIYGSARPIPGVVIYETGPTVRTTGR